MDKSRLDELNLYRLIRPEVRVFAHTMEKKFNVNEDRGDPFAEVPLDFLIGRLGEELGEFYSTLAAGGSISTLRDEAADVANFLLMIVEWRKRHFLEVRNTPAFGVDVSKSEVVEK